jgi:hypothetical protein
MYFQNNFERPCSQALFSRNERFRRYDLGQVDGRTQQFAPPKIFLGELPYNIKEIK